MNLKNQINQEIKSDECTEKKSIESIESNESSKSSHRSADYLSIFVAHL